MKDKEYKKVLAVSKKVFLQENKRFNGIMKFSFIKNDITGETVFYSPDDETSKRIHKCLGLEFNKLLNEAEEMIKGLWLNARTKPGKKR